MTSVFAPRAAASLLFVILTLNEVKGKNPRISPLLLPVLLLVIPQRSGGICFGAAHPPPASETSLAL
jgi:hypothetical protein